MTIHVDFIEQALHQLDELEALGQGFFDHLYTKEETKLFFQIKIHDILQR
jgi:hypothetical protein